MKTKNIRRYFVLVWMLAFLGIKAQTTLESKSIKQVSVTYQGVTDTVDLMPITIDNSGNVIVSGNQKMSATQYDATTVSGGISSWIDSYNTGTNKAFITCNTHDPNGNVYVAGAIRQNSTNGLDYLLIKYNNAGTQLWSFTWNGTNSTTDVVSAICFKNGQVYITGASDGAGANLIDIVTIRVNAVTGAQSWANVARYNYNNSIDVPTGIAVDLPANAVFVSGSSGSSFTDWDFVTVKYGIATGNQLSVTRTPNAAGAAQDKVFGMVTDNAGNVYVAGTTWNGTNYDIQVVKLDTALNQIFAVTWDGHNLDDAGISIGLDASNNLYVSGSSYLSNGTRELVVLKYSNSGTLLKTFQRQPTPGQDAEGLRLKVSSNNEIFVGGNCGSGNNQDVVLLCLNTSLDLTIEKKYNGTGGLKDKFMDLALEGNRIYISARTCTSSTSTVDNNITIQYEYQDQSQTVASVGTGTAIQRYVDKEVIINFNKKVLKMSAINDKEFPFGKLTDFVHDSTCNKIELKLDPDHMRGLDAKNMDCRKIFYEMTEADSLSESRTGNYIKVPEFYCALLIKYPAMVNTLNSISPLNTIHPDINYAQLNNVGTLCSPPPPNTNDTYFANDQGALHSIPNYSLGHINADSAWAVITGTSSVRLGIADTGIEPGHTDMPSNIPGFDFVANTNLGNGDNDNHGSGVAATAGAIRNNNMGIAGVAGGDASSSQPGVTIYDIRTSNNGFAADNHVVAGIYKGANGTNLNGFALHVMNFGYFWAVGYNVNIWGHGVNQITIDAMNYANRNGVAQVWPKANFNAIGTNIFPADWSDAIQMSVGSNGWDGEYCKNGVNCSNASTQWGQIDFVAPGTIELVKTHDYQGGYQVEDGTSYATPHVSGAISLMMGYRNSPNPSWDNLVHEDCEYILQKTTTDCKDSIGYLGERTGYDSLTGWGRINAYQALKAINNNYYRIRHITESIGSTGTSGAILNTVFTDTMTWTNYPGVPTGTYVTEIWKRTTIINFALLPSEQIIDAWPLHKECYGTKFDSTYVDCDRPYYGRIDQLTSSSCKMTTFYYKIPSLNVHMPYAPGAIKSAFSLYTYDSTGTVGIKKNPEIVNYANFKLFPNPHNCQFDVEFNSDYDGQLTYKLTNILGQEALKGTYKANFGKNSIKISTSDLTHGVYIFTIFSKSKQLHQQKVIKE